MPCNCWDYGATESFFSSLKRDQPLLSWLGLGVVCTVKLTPIESPPKESLSEGMVPAPPVVSGCSVRVVRSGLAGFFGPGCVGLFGPGCSVQLGRVLRSRLRAVLRTALGLVVLVAESSSEALRTCGVSVTVLGLVTSVGLGGLSWYLPVVGC